MKKVNLLKTSRLFLFTFFLYTLLFSGILQADNFVRSEIQFPGLRTVDDTFFFDGVLYVTGESQWSRIGALWQCNLHLDGSISDSKYLGDIPSLKNIGAVGPTGRKGFSVKPVIFNGYVYFFFTERVDDYNLKISYVRSPSPGSLDSWSASVDVPNALVPCEVIDTSSANRPDCLDVFANYEIHPIVFNNYIYLFYSDGCSIHHMVFDGETWTKKSFSNIGFNHLFSRFFCVITGFKSDGTEHLYLVGSLHDGGNRSYVWEVGDNTLYWAKDIKYDWVSPFAPIGGFCGTITNGNQDLSLLQLFFNSTYFLPWQPRELRRCEVSIDTNNPNDAGGWHNTEIVTRDILDEEVKGIFNITDASVLDANNNIRVYKILNDRGWVNNLLTGERTVVFYAYKSDLLVEDTKATREINTASADTLEKGCWTVLGVIEGVPPFALNGSTPPPVGSSSVKYGKTKTDTFIKEMNFDASAAANIGGSIPVKAFTFGLNGGLKQSFGILNKFSRFTRMSVTFTFNNGLENIDGSHGWLIISKPTLEYRAYDRKPANFYEGAATSLGRFSLLRIKDTSIVFEPYKLSNPPVGMKPRPPSVDLTGWQYNNPDYKNEITYYDDIKVIKGNPLKCDLTSGQTTVEFQVGEEKTSAFSSSTNLTIKGELSIAKLFGSETIKASAEAGVTMTTRETVVYNMADSVYANSYLLKADSSFKGKVITSITVQPIWYLPKENTTLKSMEYKPFWVADEYAKSNLIPWCITWQVIEKK